MNQLNPIVYLRDPATLDPRDVGVLFKVLAGRIYELEQEQMTTISNYSSQLEHAAKKLDEYQKALLDETSAVANARDVVQETRDKLNAQYQKVSDLEARLKMLTIQRDDSEREYLDKVSALTDADGTIKSLKSDLAHLRREKDESDASLAKARQVNTALSADVSELHGQISALKGQLAALKDRFKEVQPPVVNLKLLAERLLADYPNDSGGDAAALKSIIREVLREARCPFREDQ